MADEERVQPELVVGFEAERHDASYTKRDLLLYSVGIGCKNTEEELPFLYEDHERFTAFPTFPLVLPFKGTSQDVVPFPSPILLSFPPGLPVVNPAMILHAEQSLYILEPLSTDGGALTFQSRIVGLYDKGKGALLREETKFYEEGGKLVAVAISGSFMRGLTGFESKGTPLPPRVTIPSRPADATFEDPTTAQQALVYRLSGDYNALHADPDIAAAVGFDRPILHGLCTYGHAARAVYLTYGDNNPSSLRSIAARFSKPAFPGETLVTSLWKLDNHRIVFQTSVKERGAVVLDIGLAVVGGSPLKEKDMASKL